MPWRRGNINGLSILWQLGLDETLCKIDAYGLPFHGRSHRHAATHSRQVRYGAESVCEVAFSFRHVLSLHNEAHLEPLNPQFVLSSRVSFDLVMEAGGDDPCAHGQFASLDLFQAAAPEQAWHLVALLVLPNRRQSLVAHRRAVVLRVGLSQVYPRQIMECLARFFLLSLPKLCTGVQAELVPLRSPDSDSFLPICQSQEQSLNFGSQSLILRH